MSQQQPPVRSDRRTPSRARRLRAVAAAGVLVVLPLVTACGGGGGDKAAPPSGSGAGTPSVSAAPAAGVVAPAKVEVIAGLAGCTAKIRTEADELREGVCHTAKGDFLITTFPEERLKETWLESARVYGGTYLVGMRWVVSAEPELLEPLRAKLGGTVRELSGIGPGADDS
ncbi:hypothetical protein [Streptomyces lomondensis]|uniref:Lipoprotein n=1 Tax=Streptomyces lomondensis TaxID=68229 RepID=A0ABQ2X3A9_9ACTN|nr:hypothetical protein [Streptomyces lomondensis]MCF0079987.1 hypothetical protein [Streptomyces lomondensis]GGW96955.1 hypothetical protein GCM10010383_28430 [Streptomyces lomondensis]